MFEFSRVRVTEYCMKEIQGKLILALVSARFELARVRVLGTWLYIPIVNVTARHIHQKTYLSSPYASKKIHVKSVVLVLLCSTALDIGAQFFTEWSRTSWYKVCFIICEQLMYRPEERKVWFYKLTLSLLWGYSCLETEVWAVKQS